MNKDFQDRIDDYVLGRMSAEEKARFEEEVSGDESKREQLEFTQNVKKAISSREEKIARLNEMKMMYDEESNPASQATGTDDIYYCPAPKKPSRRIWLWASGIAAIFIIGLLVIKPFNDPRYSYEETTRGDEDEVFDNITPEKEYHRRGFGCSRKKDDTIKLDSKITDTIINHK